VRGAEPRNYIATSGDGARCNAAHSCPFQSAFTAAVRTLLDQGLTEIADVHLEATPVAIGPRLQAVHAQLWILPRDSVQRSAPCPAGAHEKLYRSPGACSHGSG
jgi:hypothetical protein